MDNYYTPKKGFFSKLKLPKFNFKKSNKSTVSLNGDAKKFKFSIRWGLIFKIFGGFVLLIVLVVGVLAAIYAKPALAIYDSAQKLKDSAFTMRESLKTQDLEKIENSLVQFKTDFSDFKTSYNENIGKFQNLPVVKNYVGDAEHFINAGEKGIELGLLVTETLDPYAAELGLKEGSSRLNNEQRIKQIAQVLPKFGDEVDKVSSLLVDIDAELSKVDETKYPEEFRGIAVKEQISSTKTVFSQLAQKSPKFKGLFEQLPSLVGVEEPQTYLVLMANSTELRMGGGFTTYAVIVEVENGIPKVVRSFDTYELDVDSFSLEQRITPATAFLQQYLKVNRIYARDSLSTTPDFVNGASFFMDRFYSRYDGLGRIGQVLPEVNGVIQVNTHLAEDLLQVLGPVEVEGRSFLTDAGTYKGFSDTEFNHENVIYNLEYIANAELAETQGRKDIISFLLESILNKVLNARTENLASLASTFLESLASKDLMVYSFNEETQSALEDLGYTGSVKPNTDKSMDYLFVVHSNFGAGKRDWIVERETSYEVVNEGSRNVAKLTINTKNPNAPEWWEPSWLYTYKDYMRVYVPKGAKLISAKTNDGQDLDEKSFTDTQFEGSDIYNDYFAVKGLDYFSFFFQVEEGKEVVVNIQYELPDTINVNDYKLMVHKQSGTHGDLYRIIKGNEEKRFTLSEDTQISF